MKQIARGFFICRAAKFPDYMPAVSE